MILIEKPQFKHCGFFINKLTIFEHFGWLFFIALFRTIRLIYNL